MHRHDARAKPAEDILGGFCATKKQKGPLLSKQPFFLAVSVERGDNHCFSLAALV